MEQLVTAAIENRADLLFAGDITETRPPDSVVSLLQKQISRVLDVNLKVLYTCGNHDADRHWIATSPELHDRVIHLHQKRYQFGDATVLGLDYAGRNDFLSQVANLPSDIRILVCHQRFAEAFGFDNYHCSLDDMPPQIRLVLAGDIHNMHESVNAANGARLVYPGAPFMTKINENAPFGYMMLESDNPFAPSWRPLQSRAVLRAVVEGPADVGVVIDMVKKTYEAAARALPVEWVWSLAAPIVEVRYYIDEMAGVEDTIRDALISGDTVYGHVFPHPLTRRDQKTMEALKTATAAGTDLTMAAFVGQEVDHTESPIEYDAVNSLLNGVASDTVIRNVGIQCGLSEAEVNHILPRR